MAQSINQRIVLVGSDEVKRALQDIAAAGQKSGDQLKTSFENSNRPVTEVTRGLGEARLASNNMRIALLEFEGVARGTFDGLASGSSILRVAAQQAGRFAQAIQFAGGTGPVLGRLTNFISGIVTPTRLAEAGLLGIGVAIGILGDRIRNDSNRVKEFGAVLQGLGLGTGIPGNIQQTPTVLRGTQGLAASARLRTPAITGDVSNTALNQSAKNLRDVGLSADEAFKRLLSVLQSLNNIPNLGLSARGLEEFVRTGEKLNVILGKGAAQEFLSALAKSGESLKPLQDIAKKLRIPVTGLEDANTLLAEIEGHVKNTPVLFDPIAIKAREVKIRFEEIADTLEGRLQKGLINANDNIVNTVNTVKAFSAAFNAVIDTITRGDFAKVESVLRNAFSGAFPDPKSYFNQLVQDSQRLGLEIYNAINNQISKINFSGAFSNLPKIINDLLNSVTLPGEKIGQDLGKTLASVLPTAVTTAFNSLDNVISSLQNSLVGIWTAFENAANSAIGTVSRLLSNLLDLSNRVFGSAPVASAAIPPVTAPDTGVTAQDLTAAGFASGGIVRGPGSGISDSILTRISNGEFIVNAAATKANLPLLNAINSMNRPIRSNRGFAAGGLMSVADAASPHSQFTLVIEGKPYSNLTAPSSTADSLIQHAKISNILSLGAPPSWKGAR